MTTLTETNSLQTPIFIGTTDERLDSLNLWTSFLASLKKVTDFPTNENKINLLNGLLVEVRSTLDRIMNVTSTIPIVPQIPTMNNEEKAIMAEQMKKLFGTNEDMKRWAGLK